MGLIHLIFGFVNVGLAVYSAFLQDQSFYKLCMLLLAGGLLEVALLAPFHTLLPDNGAEPTKETNKRKGRLQTCVGYGKRIKELYVSYFGATGKYQWQYMVFSELVEIIVQAQFLFEVIHCFPAL